MIRIFGEECVNFFDRGKTLLALDHLVDSIEVVQDVLGAAELGLLAASARTQLVLIESHEDTDF